MISSTSLSVFKQIIRVESVCSFQSARRNRVAYIQAEGLSLLT